MNIYHALPYEAVVYLKFISTATLLEKINVYEVYVNVISKLPAVFYSPTSC